MNPWLILAVVLGVGLVSAGGYYKGHSDGSAEVKADWDKEVKKQQQEHILALQKAAERQNKLQVSAEKLRLEKEREIREINARATALSNSLRNRPERSAEAGSMSNSAKSCAGASGAELARGDGEFLAGYSTDAAKLDKALDQCIRQYELLREAANE